VGKYTHHTADFRGVAPALLRDASLLGGLVVAAAGAAGLSAAASPVVRTRGADGVTAVLVLEAEGCHVTAHSAPEHGLLLLDVLVPAIRDGAKAVDVFVRRLNATHVERRVVTRDASAS
jgi:S-adenosylmethionine/arginine decarboxylase-like enzyme